VPRAGDQLGKYQLEGLLGRGGMGEVWAAHDPDLDRRVAVKVLSGAVTNSTDGLARLQREGRAMARLRHPNVITVYDAAFADQRGLIAMELIDGENFASWLARAHPRSEVVDALLAAGRGLAAAHDAGMLHRDFKPQNVLVERGGRVLVTDFGLARAIGSPAPPQPADVAGTPAIAIDPLAATIEPAVAPASEAPVGFDSTIMPDIGDTAVATTVAPDRDSTGRDVGESGSLDSALTQTGSLLGTPAYMAPEQVLARATDARCDQFAFCVTAWEALTGARPFRGTDLGALLAAIERHEVVNEARVPRRLRAILRRGLASDPNARWPSMAELLRTFERAWRRPRRIALASGAIVALGAVAVAFAIVRQPAEPTCADEGAAIGELWNPMVASQLHFKLIATGAPHAERMYGGIAAGYTRYTAAWTSMRTSACTAHREGDAAAARTLACLDVRRTALATSIYGAMLNAGTRTLGSSTTAFLEPIATCAHPTDATGRFDDAARVRQAIHDADDRYRKKGERQEARRELDHLASELGYPPLRAEVLVAVARLARFDEDWTGAEAALRQALALAEGGGDDRIKIQVAIEWADALLVRGQLDEAKRTLDSAEASLAGFGIDIKLEAWLARERGSLATSQGSLDEAARQYERALDLGQVDHDTIAGRELIEVYTKLGRTADAQALKSRLEAQGSAVVVVSDVDRAAEQCEHAKQNGELEEAIVHCSEAVAIAEKSGADPAAVALRRLRLGMSLALHGDHAKARAQYLAAAATAETLHAKTMLTAYLLGAGKESLALDDAPAAIDQFRRCAEVAGELGKPGEEVRLYARAGLGRALATAQQDTEAITELEWALPRLESMAIPQRVGTTRFALAEALWRRNGHNDRARARVLAIAAREFEVAQKAALKDSDPLRAFAAKEVDEVIARIDGWVSTHQ
jgi:serine/threonine protein kinase/tetratricopeptide (TPR) repeat protein